MAKDSRRIIRDRIHKRIRAKVQGTEARPRLSVFRSIKHITVQVIDDSTGNTLVAASSTETKKGLTGGGNVAGAVAIGKLVAERAKEKGVTTL